MMDDMARGLMQKTFDYWSERGVQTFDIDHFIYTMIKNQYSNIMKTLKHFNIDADTIIKDIDQNTLGKNKGNNNVSSLANGIKITSAVGDSLNASVGYIDLTSLIANGDVGNINILTVDHLFLGMVTAPSSKLCAYFADRGIDSTVVAQYMASLDDTTIVDNYGNMVPNTNDTNISNVGDNKEATDTLERSTDGSEEVPTKGKSFTDTKGNSNSKKTPLLNQFGTDLTQYAKVGKIGPVIGRSKEIDLVLEILCRKNKRNAILLGDPGVGKTAIAEGVAIALSMGKVPLSLKNKRLIQLNTVDMVAGTRYRGDFEERIKYLIAELTNSKDIVLFIDEIHTIMGAGNGSGGLDMGNVLKPALARGDIQVIGATTQDEYSKYFMRDGALERRFQTITVKEPDDSDAIDILNGLKTSFEDYHMVSISNDAIDAAVRYSKQYIPDRNMPDKCIDLLDIAGARSNMHTKDLPEDIIKMQEDLSNVIALKNKAAKTEQFSAAAQYYNKENSIRDKLQKREKEYYASLVDVKPVITSDDIANIISSLTEIPTDKISKNESQALLSMEDNIKKHLVGQDDAVVAVSRAIRRARTDLHEKKRPIGSFMFMGPTGVGKTELARILAVELFGKEDRMIKLDMSEYMERFDVSKLLGAPPGFVGYEEGGKLTEAVRKQPYSIVLFDEIEKAHPDVYNILLQILEDGVVTDAKDRKVHFNNCIIILTSNVGAEEALSRNKVGFSEDKEKDLATYIQNTIMKNAKLTFRPEFLNRLDDMIVFKSLDHRHLEVIVDKLISKLNDRISHRNIKLIITDNMRNAIIDKGYDPKYGARPIKRSIQSLVEDYVADKMLRDIITNNMDVTLDYNKDTKEITHTIVNNSKEIHDREYINNLVARELNLTFESAANNGGDSTSKKKSGAIDSDTVLNSTEQLKSMWDSMMNGGMGLDKE